MKSKRLAKIIMFSSLLLTFSYVSSVNAKAEVVSDSTYNCIYNDVYSNLTPYMQGILKGTSVSIVDTPICDIEGYDYLSGNTVGLNCIGKNKIFVSTITEYRGSPEHRFYHELGHSLDKFTAEDEAKSDVSKKIFYVRGMVGRYSTTKKFEELSDKYYDILKKNSYEAEFGNDIHERFAETFAIYKDNEHLRNKMPDLYEYLDEIASKDAFLLDSNL